MRYRYFLYHPDLKRPARLKFEPVGWDSLKKSFSRDRKYHGIFTKYTPKLKFVKDGKSIIHNLYEVYGPECEILIFIDLHNGITRKWERDYTGRLNLMTFEVSNLFAECNIENTGFVQKFLNRDEVKVNLQKLVNHEDGAITPFTPEYITTTLHSKVIEKTQRLERIEEGEATSEIVDVYPGGSGTRYVQTSLNSAINEIGEHYDYIDAFVATEPIAQDKYTTKVDDVSAGVFDFNFAFKAKARAITIGVVGVGDNLLDLTLIFKIRKVNGTITTYTVAVIAGAIFSSPNQYDSGFLNVILAVNDITLEVGDEYYYYWNFLHSSGGSNRQQELVFDLTADNYFQAVVQSTYPATACNMSLAHEAFARVCQATTGDNDPIRSNHFGRVDSDPVTYPVDGPGSLRGIFNGFAGRGFPIIDKQTSCSFKDLYETFSMIDGIGAGIEVINGKEYVVLELLDHFYQATEIMKLNWVKDIKKKAAEDYYYSDFEIGYKKWANQEVNNLDEFNTRREGIFPITQVKKTLSLISPYIGSGYTLEFLRRDQYAAFKTKDNENDNENFVLQLRRSGGAFVPDKNQDFDTIENVISPETIYNAKLSLTRCLKRNGRLIRSFLEKYKDKKIVVTVSEGNGKLITKLTTEDVSVDESADILISDLDKPLWLPELYRFKAPLTLPQFNSLNLSPYGYISFSATDKDHKKCYVLEAERDPKTRLFSFMGLKANL